MHHDGVARFEKKLRRITLIDSLSGQSEEVDRGWHRRIAFDRCTGDLFGVRSDFEESMNNVIRCNRGDVCVFV